MNRSNALLTAERCRPAWFRLALVHLATIPFLAAASRMQVAQSTISIATSAQICLLGLWLFTGTGRSARRLAIAFLLGILLMALPLLSMQTVGYGFASFFLLFFGTAFQMGLIAIPLGILYSKGWRLVDKPEGLDLASGSPLQYRVSHLLAWTTLVAVILALRNFVQSQGTIEPTGRMSFPPDSTTAAFAGLAIVGVTLSLLFAAVITVFWACLGLHPPGYRLTISAALVLLLRALPLHIAGGSGQIDWATHIMTFMAIVIASLLFLRYQGIRLVNIRDSSGGPGLQR